MIGVIQLLKATAGVTALVGSGDNARIYPLERPQSEALPAVVVRILNDEPQDTKDGSATVSINTTAVYCMASTFLASRALAAAVKTAIDRQSGTYGGENIQNIFYEDQDTYINQIGGKSTGGVSGSNNEVYETEHIYSVWIKS